MKAAANFWRFRCPIPVHDTMKITASLSVFALSLLFLAGCQNESSSYLSQGTTKYSIEGTEKFALLDRAVQAAITCTGLQEGLDPKGRLDVVANIKNRLASAIRVRIRCVFKDAHGFVVGGETPWRGLSLAEESTEAVRFTATNGVARKYTILVRSEP